MLVSESIVKFPSTIKNEVICKLPVKKVFPTMSNGYVGVASFIPILPELSIVITVEAALSSIPVDVKLVILSPAVIAISVPPVVLPIASISANVSCPSTAASTYPLEAAWVSAVGVSGIVTLFSKVAFWLASILNAKSVVAPV